MKLRIYLLCTAIVATTAINAEAEALLKGSPIGSSPSVDYTTFGPTTTVNTPRNAFDGNPDTFYASYDRSFTWAGLEFDEPMVITRVGYMARNESIGPGRMTLGVFQGANNPDFSDALPFHLIEGPGTIGTMTYADVDCSKGFRYVRYVGPHDARCNVAELEFYGYPSEGDDSHLFQVTNLPLVVVNTPGMEWFHDDKDYAMEGSQIYIIAGNKIDTNSTGQIRGRGNASWSFPKKPFRIKFDKKQTVLGGPANAKKWTMINNYGDKTLMRNMLAHDISRNIGMDYTPACNFVDLIFNGEFLGSYQLCDQVEVNPNRVNITEMKAEDIEGEALTGGYLIEVDANADEEPDDKWFISTGGNGIYVTIKSPEPGIPEQYNYIRQRFSDLESLVMGSNFDDPDEGYRRMIDLDTFLKHFIVGELTGNCDTYWSTFMTLDRGAGQFRVGPVWDFDIAFDNDYRTYPINDKDEFVTFFKGSFTPGMENFVRRILRQDTQARERMKYLWSYAREYQNFNEEYFLSLIDTYSETLDQSQQLNFVRWPILNSKVHVNPVARGSYKAEVENVRSYLSARFDKLDQLIGRVYVGRRGDVNGDGLIDIADLSALIDHIVEGLPADPGSDLNSDDIIDVSDISSIIDLMLSSDGDGDADTQH